MYNHQSHRLSLTGVPSDRSSSLGWLTTDHCSLSTGRVPPTPLYPLGYKFPLKPCRLFLNSLESMPVEKYLPQNIPHGEIWPLKIAGKCLFLPEKGPEASLQGLFADLLTRSYLLSFSAAKANLACSTSSVKPFGSFTAISARILRSSSTLAFFRPLMSCE
jgi:hypothetical protein